jgi:hypothetical protein
VDGFSETTGFEILTDDTENEIVLLLVMEGVS